MKYQQVPLRRLSAAGARLTADGAWHASAHAVRSWYRVTGGIVQRIALEDGEDEHAMLALADSLRPLPAKALRAGFRDELLLRVRDDRYALEGTLVRAFVGWDRLALALRRHNAELRFFGGNSLECVVWFDAWTPEDVAAALVTSKAAGLIATSLAEDAAHGIPHSPAEVAGLLGSAYDVIAEECGVGTGRDTGDSAPAARRETARGGAARTPPHGGLQASLFTE